MKRKILPLLFMAGVASISTANLSTTAVAKEPFAEYLSALRENGYGEMAVLYLEQAKAKTLPEDFAATYELEMGLSRVVSAAEAFNPDQANQRLDQATAHLSAFLKANPTHDSAGLAVDGLASMYSDRGIFEIRQARVTKDPVKQKAAFEQARKYFVLSRTHQAQTVARAQKLFLELNDKKKEKDGPKAKPGVKKPIDVRRTLRKPTEEENELKESEGAWQEARMNLALLDYHEATTYTDVALKERKDLLTAAAKKFDDIYQGDRASLVGVYSHMWHARCIDELGDIKQALDIYEEVLAVAEAASGGEATGLEELFAQVENYYLLLLRKKGANEDFRKQAEEWLTKNKKMKSMPGYQGIALELAKYQITQTKDLSAKDREDKFREILKSLGEIAKVPSEHKNEAILLRRQYQAEAKGGETVTIATFDEGMAVAQDASSTGRWDEAIQAYTKSIELADKTRDGDKIRKVKFMLAGAQLMGGKPDAAIVTAQELVKENATAQFSPESGALSVQAALQIYAGAAKSGDAGKLQAAVKQLSDLSDDTIRRWPTRPEADDARIAKGQAAQVGGDVATALMTYESINADSLRYPLALYYSGQTYWRKYLADRVKKDVDPTALAATKTKAEQALVKSLAGQQKQMKAGEQPPKSLVEAQTILGEMALESAKFEPALAYLDPLADVVVKSAPLSLDPLSLRQVMSALRARLSLGRIEDLQRLGDLAGTLLKAQGNDVGFVNSALSDYTKLVEKDLKATKVAIVEAEKAEQEADAADAAAKAKADKSKAKADIAAAEATEKVKTEKQAARTAAETKRDELQDKWTELINQLGERRQLSLAGSVYVAESQLVLTNKEKAKEQFTRIRDREREPNFLPSQGGQQAMIRVRSQLAGLLRDEGKFDEALKEVEGLIRDTKGLSLEPLVEKCRLTQAKAEKAEKDLPAWTQAVVEWTQLRNRMQAMKKKPPEYYDVVYSLGESMMKKYALSKDKKDAEICEQLVKATLALAPDLNGPEAVEKFNELKAEAEAVRTGKPYVKKVKVNPLAVATGDGGQAGGEKKPEAKPAEPAKPPVAPAPKPTTPAAKPATPAAKPTTPAAKPATPAAKPATPAPAKK